MRPVILQTSAIGFGVCLVLGTGCGDVAEAEVESVDAAYTFRDCAARYDACGEAGRESERCREAYATCIEGADTRDGKRPEPARPTAWELTERQCWRDFDVCTDAGVTPARCRARLGQCLALVGEGDERPTGEGDERPTDPPRDPPSDGADRCREAYDTCLVAAPDPERCRAEFARCEGTDLPSDERPTTEVPPTCDDAYRRCVVAGYDESACAERHRVCEAAAPR